MAGGIPDDVAALIASHIESVEQLEVLLFLRRAGEPVTVDETMAAVRTHPRSIAARLDDLVRRGLVVADGDRYGYAAGERARDAAVDGLADCYARRRTSVIAAIFGDPDESLRAFADSFRLRRDR
jgi:hypothetical protein